MSIIGDITQICLDAANAVNISFIYYTHIPIAIISVFIGIFVLINNRDLISKILFSLSISFLALIIINLITWRAYNLETLTFYWSFFGLITSLIFVLCFYFSYVFLFNRDLSVKIKTILLIFISTVSIITASKFDIKYFDGINCMPVENTNFLIYYFFSGFLSAIAIFIMLINKIIYKDKSILERTKDVIFVIGIEFFILMLFFASFLASYLYDIGWITGYDMEPYGLIGAVIFMAVLAFLIVKFKAFNIKLIGAQALVWAMVILVGSQFLFVQSLTAQILTGITLFISAFVGIMIVRSVKKEIALREELEVVNNNQQLLIRFITHQVKGFFTKSKMIFASALEGDLGELNDGMKDMMKIGLESDNKAVDMVQEVLKASSLRTGQMTYDFQEVPVVDFIKEIAEGFRETAVAKGLGYEVNLPTDNNLKFKIDKLQMTQVIKNLIDNSVKYTPTGTIKINLTSEGQKILFTVKDNGIGLSDDDKSKLFKEGGRGEESMKVNVNSTGYGLFIVKKIVEGHGGKIWAESAGRGHGSTFYVQLNLEG